MALWKFISRRFLRDEDGAVTVDWVLLTAAVAFLSIPAVGMIGGALQTGADTVATDVENSGQ
jgi:Flp pilus assembly pilin Flp